MLWDQAGCSLVTAISSSRLRPSFDKRRSRSRADSVIQCPPPRPRLIGIEVSYRTPPNSVVAKVPVFGVLHETFRPKSAKSRVSIGPNLPPRHLSVAQNCKKFQ